MYALLYVHTLLACAYMVYTHTIIVEPFCFLHRFKIESVYPGTYQITASHPVWKISQVHVVAQDNLSMHTSLSWLLPFSQDPVQVVIIDAPVTVPAGLTVLGYDVKVCL